MQQWLRREEDIGSRKQLFHVLLCLKVERQLPLKVTEGYAAHLHVEFADQGRRCPRTHGWPRSVRLGAVR